MRYGAVRERRDGRYDFTELCRGQIHRVGHCTHEGHATREAAAECFYESRLRELDQRRWEPDSPCEVCGVPTPWVMETRYLQAAALCDEHRTEETFRSIRPCPGPDWSYATSM